MDVYVARQPILNQKGEAVAFELLYRGNGANQAFPSVDPDDATVDVLVQALFNIGWERISDGKPCFVNFSHCLLLRRLPHQVPASSIVVELLEGIETSPPVIDACCELKRKGFQIALDDVTIHDKDHPMLELADYAKIDFLKTSKEERRMLAERVRKFKRTKLLAEKVETWHEFEEAKAIGCEYFQGYFFCKPALFKGRDLPKNPLTSLTDLYVELHRREPNVEKLAAAIERDVSLSYMILKMTRTPAFMTRHKVRSIRHAIMLLGIEEVKKIVYLLSLKKYTVHPSPEPLRVSLVRAKLCEWLARFRPEVYRPDECFLLGLFSLLDVLMGVPMDEALRDLPPADPVADTLRGKADWPEHTLFQCAVLLEKGDLAGAFRLAAVLDIAYDDLYRLYLEALAWADEMFAYVRT